MRVVLLCLSAHLFLMISPAFASDKNGKYEVLGQGTESCGAWLSDRKDGSWYPEGGWINGYISAYNLFVWKKSADVAQSTDAAGIAAWMDGYCTAHPLNEIEAGSYRLVTVLGIRAIGGTLDNEYGE